MKSDFVGIGEADLISSEAIRRRFHPSIELQNNSLGFHRATHDFIKDTRLRLDLIAEVWYNINQFRVGDHVCEIFYS